MIKIAVTSKGNIGSRLIDLGAESMFFDVLDSDEIVKELSRVRPDVIIHTASISSVEECERDYERAILVNTRGTNHVCEMAADVLGEGRVIMLSTDHVFDGKKGNYDEADEPIPINDYGLTKLAAEGLVLKAYGGRVIRLSRCFDSHSKDIATYLTLLRAGHKIYVPDFITRSYCHMDFVAEAVWEFANRPEMPDLLHLGGSYPLSFHNFMFLVAEDFGLDPFLVQPRKQDDSGFAKRPLLGGLDVSLARVLGLPLYTPAQSIERMKHE